MSRSTLSLRALLALAGALVAAPAAAGAQANDIGQLSIHGYFTQALARSVGAQHYGMTKDWSTDFRYAALQFRYDREKNGFVVQLNHRRLGESPIMDFESNVNVNWAFYERRISDATTVRVGRVPIPRGIYNEERAVGVVLPFYRVPVYMYDEAAFFSETIDGATLRHTFADGRPWSLDVHVFGGGWKMLAYDQQDTAGYTIYAARADQAVGTQLWLNTPVDGVRLGVAAQRWRYRYVDGQAIDRSEPAQQVRELQGSLDVTRRRYFVRAEALVQDYLDSDNLLTTYVQAGCRITRKLSLNVQGDYGEDRHQTFAPDWPSNVAWNRAGAVGLAYDFDPSLVLKVEQSWNRAVQVEQYVDANDPPRFNYTIVSLSAAF